MKNKRTCDYIAEAIQNEILSGRMEAGQPLRQEELSEKLGYSRMPVREALQILEEQGLVRRLATRHEFVYGTITNGLFRRLLETSADCYIRFASEETEMGKDPEQKQLRRNKLETVHSAYCRKDTVVMEVALEEYYRLLTEM